MRFQDSGTGTMPAAVRFVERIAFKSLPAASTHRTSAGVRPGRCAFRIAYALAAEPAFAVARPFDGEWAFVRIIIADDPPQMGGLNRLALAVDDAAGNAADVGRLWQLRSRCVVFAVTAAVAGWRIFPLVVPPDMAHAAPPRPANTGTRRREATRGRPVRAGGLWTPRGEHGSTGCRRSRQVPSRGSARAALDGRQHPTDRAAIADE